jgi:uncharacterized protein (TIGR02001 family)
LSSIFKLPGKKEKIMRKIKIFVFSLSAALAASAMAADDATLSQSPFAYNVGITSDYIFRGITQTTHSPALQGGVDYTHTSGLYLGGWASNVKRNKDFGAIATGDANV